MAKLIAIALLAAWSQITTFRSTSQPAGNTVVTTTQGAQPAGNTVIATQGAQAGNTVVTTAQ